MSIYLSIYLCVYMYIQKRDVYRLVVSLTDWFSANLFARCTETINI